MTFDDEREFEVGDDGDPDTNLILDYLSNKLEPEDAERLEARAKEDKDFRYKLADIVLLKGLVMLALEKNPSPAARSCRRTQRLFLDYLKGRTSTGKTAELSRHLDECFECEIAFERFQEHGEQEQVKNRGGWGGFSGIKMLAGRRVAIAGLVAVALAAGAFGVVGFLTSASAGGGARIEAPDTAAQAGSGLLLRPDQVRRTLDGMVAADPSLDTGGKLSALVRQILDFVTTPDERADFYSQLGKEFGPKAEPLLWVLAENEPMGLSREAAYRAIRPKHATDTAALLRATTRELEGRTPQVFALLPATLHSLTDVMRNCLRALFEKDDSVDDEWRAEILKSVYGPMKNDAAIEKRMTAYLGHRNDRVRSHAVAGSAEAGNTSVIPIAVDLLKSTDRGARVQAATVIAKFGTEYDVKTLLAHDWPRDQPCGP